MSDYLVWFVLAALAVGLELTTGTFYLLVFGIAFTGGGIAALLGLPFNLQLPIAAAIAIAGTVWLRSRRLSTSVKAEQQQTGDIGQRVSAETWHDDQHLRVRYRGTQWDAELAAPLPERPADLYITGLRGSTLLVSGTPPHA
ncbi:NfeD family protein [Parachitinimonas caeni]|uniref:NfeD family protein n=1 Tax=Parachitinimonas caeni TaxID=3031301 RepID=A0ABT7E490_9NEIS|nr:NfeD family protein [Parachitinimonas caeni]MDK2125712.1 NfeD family protein [Parachitinimonas caeni]